MPIEVYMHVIHKSQFYSVHMCIVRQYKKRRQVDVISFVVQIVSNFDFYAFIEILLWIWQNTNE